MLQFDSPHDGHCQPFIGIGVLQQYEPLLVNSATGLRPWDDNSTFKRQLPLVHAPASYTYSFGSAKWLPLLHIPAL